MQHQRSNPITHEHRRCVEAAILALLLAEDWPWRTGELAARLSLPDDVAGLGTATLLADGLIVPARAGRGRSGDRLRASWTAVRTDELLCCRAVETHPARTSVEPVCAPAGLRYPFTCKANDRH